MNSQLLNLISPAQFSSSWLLCFHDITWPLLSLNFALVQLFDDTMSSWLFPDLTISILASFSSPKSRQASPKCPVRGHLFFMLSLHIHIPSYTFHYFLNANEPQVCIMNCSLSCSFTFPAPHWGTCLHTILLLQQSWGPPQCHTTQGWTHLLPYHLPSLTLSMASVLVFDSS